MDEFAATEELSSGYYFAKECVTKVVGVGSGGCTLLQYLINAQLRNAHLLDFVAVDSDSTVLARSTAPCKIQIGADFSSDFGSASDATCAAVNSTRAELKQALCGSDLIIIVTALGGATGSGATPIIAELAQATGASTLCFASSPLSQEEPQRLTRAAQGLEALEQLVDSCFVIAKDKLVSAPLSADKAQQAWAAVNEAVLQGVRGITYPIHLPWYLGLDFSDVMTITRNCERTMFGYGEGRGPNFVAAAVQNALHSPLVEPELIKRATGLLVTALINRNSPISKWELINREIQNYADEEANCKCSIVYDDQIADDQIFITIFITKRAPDASSGENQREAETFNTAPLSKGPSGLFRAAPPQTLVRQSSLGQDDELDDDKPQIFHRKIKPQSISDMDALELKCSASSPAWDKIDCAPQRACEDTYAQAVALVQAYRKLHNKAPTLTEVQTELGLAYGTAQQIYLRLGEDKLLEDELGQQASKHVASVPKTVIFGVGGCGCKMLRFLILHQLNAIPGLNTQESSDKELAPVKLIAVDMQENSLDGLQEVPQVLLTSQIISAAEQGQGSDLIRAQLQPYVDGAELVFVATGAGGMSGSNVAPLLAQMAQESGALTVAVVIKPFSFEGAQRALKAQQCLNEIKAHSDSYIVIDNDLLLTNLGQNISVVNACYEANSIFSDAVTMMLDAVRAGEFINLNLAELRMLLNGHTIISSGVGQGEKFIEDAWARALQPLLFSVQEVQTASSLLVCVYGNRNFTVTALKRVNKLLAQRLGVPARLVLILDDAHLAEDQCVIKVCLSGISAHCD